MDSALLETCKEDVGSPYQTLKCEKNLKAMLIALEELN